MNFLKNKRVTIITIIILVILILVALIQYMILKQKSYSWNIDYVNEVSKGRTAISEILSVSEINENNGAIILGNGLLLDRIVLIYMQGDFPNHSWEYSKDINLNDISQKNSNQVSTITLFGTSVDKDQDIYYNLYLNPTTDTLKVNGEEVQVEKIPIELEGKSYTLGFWYKLFPKDTVVTVE